MKIILENKDKKFIDGVNADLRSGENAPLFVKCKRNYSVSFDVIDIAKANNFILEIVMNPNRDKVKEIEENIGIRFTSINYSAGDAKLNELKKYLRQFLNDLDNI